MPMLFMGEVLRATRKMSGAVYDQHKTSGHDENYGTKTSGPK